MDDIQIIQKTQSCNNTALSILMKSYQQVVGNYAYRILQDKGYTEDVTSIVFTNVKFGKRFKGESKPSTWIMSIARYACWNYIRDVLKKGKERPHEKIEELADADLKKITKTIDNSSKDETKKIIQECLKQLPVLERKVLVHYYYERCTFKEISKLVKHPLTTVKDICYRAEERLLKYLKSKGIDHYEM